MKIDIRDLELISSELKVEFHQLKNKKIFLTGGTGFFGKWLLETFIYLNKKYHLNVHVTILSRYPERFRASFPYLYENEMFSFIAGDIKKTNDLNEEFDFIIHAATDASAELNRTNPELMYATIMEGAKSICELAKKVKCDRILYTSSGAAYGPQPSWLDRLSEGFSDNPSFNVNDAYSYGKLKSENYFLENAPCDVVIARCFAFSGPYLPLQGSYAFGNFINDVLHDRDIVIKSSGEAIRSYLYAADLVIWLVRLLLQGKGGEIYNVGSSEKISIKDLAFKISRGFVNVKTLGEADNNKNYYVPCTDKASKQLNLRVYTSLSDSIDKTFNYYKK